MDNKENWKSNTLLLGTLIGAVSGLLASLLIIQRSEKTETLPKLSAGEGVKLGLGLLGVLKSLSDFGGK